MKRYLNVVLLFACVFSLSLPSRTSDASEAKGILIDSRFPDYNFRKALDEKYGDEYHNVSFYLTEIDVPDSGITDLTGIEYFTKLVSLDCSGNQLESLDLSRCEKLETLDCRNNPLPAVNAGQMKNLRRLYCSGDQLRVLSLPDEKPLLRILDISNSKISSLDVQGYVGLESITCINGSLMSLNASGCTSLESVYLKNLPLTSLSLEQCSHLDYLSAENCSLPSLSLIGLQALVDVKCANNPMTTLTISGCPLLESVDCSDCNLSSLSIIGCPELYDLSCQNNQLPSLPAGLTLFSLDCSGNRISDLGSYPDLTWLNCADNQLTSLTVPADVYHLDCSGNRLSALDVTQCTELSFLDCSSNTLTSLNVSGLPELHMLYTHSNSLPLFDIGGTYLDKVDGVWLGEHEGAMVMKSNDVLTIDPETTLLRNGNVIYQPGGITTPLPTFILPNGLSSIQSEAFAGIAAQAVMIPGSVTSISGNPFAGSNVRYIFGYPGTPAQELAADYHYTFIPIE